MKTQISLLALFICATLHATETELKIEGIKSTELLENVKLYVSQIEKAEADGSERHRLRITELVDKGLRALGYYQSGYQFDLKPRKAPQGDLLVLQVLLKPPVKIGEREVKISGEAEKDRDFETLVRQDLPAKGSVLNHESYENFKLALEKLAQTKGYFDGDWLYHRMEVYPSEGVADLRLAYESGERYRYGQIRFVNSQIRESYLDNIVQIKPGEHYYLNDLSRLSSDMAATNWFSSVSIEPQTDEQHKRVDLNILLQPRKRNEMEIGLGFSTDVGPRIQFGWKKPWFNSRGHSIALNTKISKPEQSVELSYKMPLERNPLYYYYQLSGGLDREARKDIQSTAATLGVERVWNHQSGWAFSVGLKSRYDAFKQGDEKFKTLLIYPSVGFNRTRSDGKRFPLWGDSQKLVLNWGSKMIGSNVNFYSAKFNTAWLRTYRDNHRIYLRGEIGYLHADQIERMPPALRYFAGGDMSIRGFGYKNISPRNKKGKRIGGTHLATASAEYQYQVYPNWWGAIFYDTGLADYQFDRKQLYSGVGVGARWASPIGTVKFDLATPLRSPNQRKGIQFYIGLGGEL